MITLFTATIIGIPLTLWVFLTWAYWGDSFTSWGEILLSTFICAAIVFALNMMAGLIILSAAVPTVEPRSCELVSSSLGDTVHGQYFLGSGSVNGVEEYRYFRKYDNGNFGRESWSVKKAQVKEVDGTPKMTWNHYVKHTPEWTGYGNKEWDDDVVFNIPKGSIIQRFDMR